MHIMEEEPIAATRKMTPRRKQLATKIKKTPPKKKSPAKKSPGKRTTPRKGKK